MAFLNDSLSKKHIESYTVEMIGAQEDITYIERGHMPHIPRCVRDNGEQSDNFSVS